MTTRIPGYNRGGSPADFEKMRVEVRYRVLNDPYKLKKNTPWTIQLEIYFKRKKPTSLG